jgi:hypothetical protein
MKAELLKLCRYMLADERFAEKTMDERGKNNKSKVGEWSGDGVG